MLRRAPTYAGDDVNDRNQGGGSVKGQCKRGRGSRRVGASSWQASGSRAGPLPVSPYERDIFHLPCCPTTSRVKCYLRTQQTNGRMRLTSELVNDAQRMHVESLDKKHSALLRHLCDEAL